MQDMQIVHTTFVFSVIIGVSEQLIICCHHYSPSALCLFKYYLYICHSFNDLQILEALTTKKCGD
jgi:hypothetical protein